MIPSVKITKKDGQTNVVRPSSDGILAIIATSEKGPSSAATYLRDSIVYETYGDGPLAEGGAYDLATTGKPVVLCRAVPSTPGAYGSVAIARVGTSTSVPSAGGSDPLDDLDVEVTITAGGMRGTPGIRYTYSLDGGETTSPETELGAATSIVIPKSGATIALAAGTLDAGDVITVTTTGPRLSNSDISNALAALRASAIPYELIEIMCSDADQTKVGTVDTWLAAREAEGMFKHAIMNSRVKGPSEAESDYKTALQTAFASTNSIRVTVAADQLYLPAPLRATSSRRPVSLAVAVRAAKIDISTDPAYVADGPVDSGSILNADGSRAFHDEASYPGLDDLRLATLMMSNDEDGNPIGPFITNAPTIAVSGSDFVYIQHARVMNRACALAWATLRKRLSEGVQKKNGFITEAEAQDIEGLVQAKLDAELTNKRRCSSVQFVLSRTDDLSSNQGGTVTGTLNVEPLAYLKKFDVGAGFVRKIAVPLAA